MRMFLIPLNLILLGIILNLKKFNTIGANGYSSPLSIKSHEAWLFAQQIAPQVILKNGVTLFLITIVLSIANTELNLITTNFEETIYTIDIAFLIIIYVTVESRLRKKFPNL
ncbi:MAG: hypothetical protein ACRDD7_17825 [Peptostreptococcaceae bacterium]